MAGSNPSKAPSALLAAATALDEELRAYDDLAHDAQRAKIDSERGLRQAIGIVQDSGRRNDRIQERLRVLVGEIENARIRQAESLSILLDTARTVQARAQEHEALMGRFSVLGESAKNLNTLTKELSERRAAGASETELLEGLNSIQLQMAAVVGEAEALTERAREQQWPEIARQADSVRQQVLSAKNKLALAHKAVASRAPS
jgi:hypothetical protein